MMNGLRHITLFPCILEGISYNLAGYYENTPLTVTLKVESASTGQRAHFPTEKVKSASASGDTRLINTDQY